MPITPAPTTFVRFLSTQRLGKTVIAALIAVALSSAPALAQTASPTKGTGLPLPRFVSLKADRVNLRSGPGTEYPTGWVFRRAGLPVEVIKEFEGWRQVRDADGVKGWVLRSFLSGRRTGLILPWDQKKSGAKSTIAAIYSENHTSSPVVVNVEAGVIADLRGCDGKWCRVVVSGYSGYIQQKKLWGVYPNEHIAH